MPRKLLTKLHVVIRDNSPFINMKEPVNHRHVTIGLTKEQQEKLALKMTGTRPSSEIGTMIEDYEEVSSCFFDGNKENVTGFNKKKYNG